MDEALVESGRLDRAVCGELEAVNLRDLDLQHSCQATLPAAKVGREVGLNLITRQHLWALRCLATGWLGGREKLLEECGLEGGKCCLKLCRGAARVRDRRA
jgi:hypothetical protein